METDKNMLRRRIFMSSTLAIAGAAGSRAFASPDQYPELDDPSPPAKNPAYVYMVAGATAGKRLLAGGEHGVIIFSDDQAHTWHQASVPVSTTITSIGFATPAVGWATAGFGVVMKSEDGGQSWVKQLDGTAEIALMNQTTQAFIATQPPDSPVVSHLSRRADILTQGGPDKPFLSLLPISPTQVFAFGTYRSAEYSTDGGKTWVDWSLKIGDPAGVSKNIYGAAALYGAYYLVSETGLIYRSTDGGQTFPQLAQPGNATFFGICDAGAGNILAYGVAGEVLLSTDNGKTWNPPAFTGTSNVNGGALLDNGQVVVGDSSGAIWLSKDNGRNFTMATRSPLGPVNALVPISGQRVLTMSSAGVVSLDLSQAQG